MKPTAQQQRVIDSDERQILVEAGAGSGKTTTIVRRYVRLIEGELEPHNILVFTFTDKAAGELRERIRKARSELAEAAGAENPEAVSAGDSWIGTFHSICARILRAYPVEAGVDPRFSVLEDTETETLKQSAFEEALRTFREAGPEGRDPFLAIYQVYRLRDTITRAYEELRSRGILSPTLPPFERSTYPADDLGFLRSAARAIADTPKLNHNYRRKAEAIEALLAPGVEGITYDDLAPFCFAARGEGVERFCEALDRATHRLIAVEVGDDYREFMAQLLEEYGRSYSRAKNLRSALDFEDLQLLTLELLRRNPGIRDDYRRRFREIMVDEFQDTNPLQLELVTLLRADDSTLLTVGDEMQSIYGFRHADVELFRSRRADPAVTTYPLSENFRSQGPVIGAINEIGVALDRQVTVRPGAERAGRHHFAELAVGLPETGASASVGLVLTGREGWKQEDLGPLAPPIPADEETGKEVDHFNEAEALQLAQRLRDLVDDPANDIRQGDIAVLLRVKTRTDIYVSALSQVGLTPYVVAGSGFWKKQEAIEVVSLLSVIANPRDDNRLLGALTSPACALSTDALWLLRKAAPDFEPLWPTLRALATEGPGTDEFLNSIPDADLQRASRFVDRIELLRSRSGSLPLDELIELAVTETGYDLAVLYRDETANGLANVRRVESLARGFEAKNGRDLRAFLDWAALSEDLDSEASVATADENSDVVRLMTVHAAKGLEFKVVCVPDLSRQNSNRHDTQLRFGRSHDDDPSRFEVGLRVPRIAGENVDLFAWKTLTARAKRATEDEELRLLHVAMTRAENHLLLSGVLPAKWPGQWTKSGSLSESTPMITRISCAFGLDPTDPEAWPETVPRDREGGVVIEVAKNLPAPGHADELRRSRDRLAVATRSVAGRPPLDRPPARIHPDVPLSFTAISDYADCPARFYVKRVLRLDDPGDHSGHLDPRPEMAVERDHGREFGNAVHEVLERLALSRWPEAGEAVIRESLERNGLDPGENDRQSRAWRMINGFRDSELGRRARANASRAEVPLLLQSGPVLIRGFIDLVVDGGPRPLIVDYKTNRLDGAEPDRKMPDYELQRGLYSLALASSSGIDEVETAWVFLEAPDDPVLATFLGPDLEGVREEVDRIVSEITAAASSPVANLGGDACGRCWACERLGLLADAPATLF